MALVPITAIKYNGVPYEKTLKDSYLIFRNGAMKNGKDAGKFPSNLDNPPGISFQDPSSTKPGQYSQGNAGKYKGAGKGPHLIFRIAELPMRITKQNISSLM